MGTKFLKYKDGSRGDWGRTVDESQNLNQDDIKLGAILRIADATEVMAKCHTELIDENVRLREALKSLEYHYELQKKSTASYKGQITKLKNKYEQK